jgi:hypothetical protein
MRLDRIIGLDKGIDEQVLAVFLHFQLHNTVERLVAALRDYRPAVPELAAVAEQCGFVESGDRRGLEVLIRDERLPYQDVGDFRSKFSKREASVCQVRTDDGLGTGSLVAGDLVLTNHHVVASHLGPDGKLARPLVCRFDYKRSAEGYATPATDVRVTDIPAWSDHAPEDLLPDGENPSLRLLDYALLRLERNVASEPIIAGGEPRGHVEIDRDSLPIARDQGVLILQHPKGKPMKIDLGAVTRVGPTRLRHSVNTEPGSSGAPVFNASLDLVALHHAGHSDWPEQGLGYNQAIPLEHILADAEAQGVEL